MPARHLRCRGSRREGGHPGDRGSSRRPPAAGCAGPHRENWPEVGVPVPARHLRCRGSRREGGHPGGRGPSRPPACGGLCRPPPGELARGRRSLACAPPALLGFTPRGGPSGRSGSVPPPACGGLCRPPPGELARGRRSLACAPPALLGSTPTGEPTGRSGSFPSARLRRAVPAPTGRTGQRSAFPVPARHLRRAVPAPTGRTGLRHLRCWGPRHADRGPSRPPACGGLCRRELARSAFPACAPPALLGSRREGGHPGDRDPSRRPPAAGCAGPHRENWPEVGVPLPVRHLRCWGPRREGGHPGDRGPSRPPACGGLCRRRSAFPCLRATCAAGVHADRGANREIGVLPVRPPAAGCAGPHRENWPEVGVPLPARHLRERRRLPDDAWPSAKKTDGSELRSLPAFSGGKCERGARPPFTKRQLQIGTRRSARQCAREFRFRREAPGGSGAGAQFLPSRQPKPVQRCAPAPGPLDPGREAPGGSGAGAQFLPSRQPKPLQQCAPAPGPLDPGRAAPGGSGAGAQFLPTRQPNRSSGVPPLSNRST